MDDFLKFMVAVLLAAAVVVTITAGYFGMAALHDHIWPPHHLVCIHAHDEFHQTNGGTKVRVCDEYRRVP